MVYMQKTLQTHPYMWLMGVGYINVSVAALNVDLCEQKHKSQFYLKGQIG